MKCRICGRDCPPGAKICRDCAAARKRAFAQTVTQPLLAAVGAPSIGAPRFAPRPVRSPAANVPAVERDTPRAEPAALPLTLVPRKLGMVWLAVTVVVVGAIALVWLRTRDGGHVIEAPTRVEAPLPPAVTVVPAAPAAIEQSAPEPMVTEAPHMRVRVARPKKVTPHPEPPAPVIATPAPPPEPVPVVRAVAPPPRPIETPRPDPWQALNDGLARCAGEALFDRIGCEQRLRVQYCGNSWGLVPQCPIGPTTDRGQ
jgi:hypothetical protein